MDNNQYGNTRDNTKTEPAIPQMQMRLAPVRPVSRNPAPLTVTAI